MDNGIAPPKGRTYALASATDHLGVDVVELHLSFGAVAQISATPDNAGFLVRVWPAGGTHEYGGDNGTVLSTVVTYDEGCRARVESLHLDRQRGDG